MSAPARDGFALIKPGQTYVGKQGFTYGAGVSTETAGAKKVCMNVLPMPPGAVAKAHYHEGIETIAYMLDGECAVYYGDDLEKRVHVQQGRQLFARPRHSARAEQRKRQAVHLDRGAFLRQRPGRHRAAAGARCKAEGADGPIASAYARYPDTPSHKNFTAVTTSKP